MRLRDDLAHDRSCIWLHERRCSGGPSWTDNTKVLSIYNGRTVAQKFVILERNCFVCDVKHDAFGREVMWRLSHERCSLHNLYTRRYMHLHIPTSRNANRLSRNITIWKG